ncbi:unnamed protein product [Leptidea sinapis]|uniref:Uncharacterized protein n=1 Tax=Leptidea sinapis TaxID=189913 RepID=A0A5E4PSR6_9NEOP|nr:unnamed protein product [Leptidea sinapis]
MHVAARQHGRLPAPLGSRPHSPIHPAPTGVRAFSCQHWESRLLAPPRFPPALVNEPQLPCDVVEVPVCIKHGLVTCSCSTIRVGSFLFCAQQSHKLASMQAALMIRAKSRERRKQRLKRGIKQEVPSNIATKTIAPFPRYPPTSWGPEYI